jgi:hypothetical protein
MHVSKAVPGMPATGSPPLAQWGSSHRGSCSTEGGNKIMLDGVSVQA